MYSRVATFTAQTGKFDEIIKLVRESFVPKVKKAKGFKGVFFLTNRETGKGVWITLWNSQADLTAALNSAAYKEETLKIQPLVTGPGTSEQYEVSVKG